MKKALLIAGICILIGILLLAAVWVLHMVNDSDPIPTISFETVTRQISEPFDSIRMQDVDAKLSILPSTDDSVYLISSESDQIFHELRIENGTLIITRRDTRAWYETIGVFSQQPTVTLYLPENSSYQTLSMQSVSGDLWVADAFAFQSISLKTTSGNITHQSKVLNDAKLDSTSGQVSLSGMAGGTLKITTTSGDIEISNSHTQELSVSSTSGVLRLRTTTVVGNTALQTASGNIDLQSLETATANVNTTSGNISGTFLTAKDFSASTVSGRIQLPQSDPTAGSVRFKTVSGNIYIELAS